MTAAYPFSRDPVSYPGAAPTDPPQWDVRSRRLWLGKPGAMTELPSPDPSNYLAAHGRGEVEQDLVSGATGVIRLPNTMSRWSITWHRLTGIQRSIIDGYYRGVFGTGPWCFVPFEDRNRLTLAQSMCGARNQVAEGWAANAGTVTYDPTQTPAVAPCGVLRWSGAGNGALLTTGDVIAGTPTPQALYSAPYLPAEPVTVSVWAWTASGTAQVTLAASGRNTAGGVVAEATTTATLTTTPQRIYATAQPGGLLTAPFVLPVITCGTSSAPDILISNPSLDYRDFPDDDWWTGAGLPRVTFAPDGRPGRSFDVHMNEPATITLADAVVGRQ